MILGKQVASDLAICAILFLFVAIANYLENRAVEQIDNDSYTTQDYAVEISNPPKEVTDPQIYHDFFNRRFGDDKCDGEIAFITIVKNNGALCMEIALKKMYETQRELLIAMGDQTDQKTLPSWKKFSQVYLGYYYTVGFLDEAIQQSKDRIRGLAIKDYKPWKVFIIFNDQAAQQNCLEKMSVSYLSSLRTDGAALENNREAVFQNKVILTKEAPEPSDIIYENSHVNLWKRLYSYVISGLICGVAMLISFFIIDVLTTGGGSNVAVAVFISIINSALPVFVKYVTLYVELHQYKSTQQDSILIKLVAVRCINTGVLIYVAVTWEQTFSSSHLLAIFNILIADAVATPIFRMVSIIIEYLLSPAQALSVCVCVCVCVCVSMKRKTPVCMLFAAACARLRVCVCMCLSVCA